MKTKSIIFTVTNDLVTDQRMHRICTTMSETGYEVTLVGRQLKDSEPFDGESYQTLRLQCIFQSGPLFYLEFNLRLFFLLHRRSPGMIGSVDMDTLWSGWLASRNRSTRLVYDAHEYFSESPELEGRHFKKRIWQWSERFLIPRVDLCYTVSESIARVFHDSFGIAVSTVRNMPVSTAISTPDLAVDDYMLYQGALNAGRGLEQLIACMEDSPIPLYLAGEGDLNEILKALVANKSLTNVRFLGRLEPEELRQVTVNARFGLNLLEDMGLSYRYSLANKFFDYIMAGIPQICIGFQEYKRANEDFEVAVLVESLDKTTILRAIRELVDDAETYERLKRNTRQARKVYNWESESKKLLALYAELND